MQKAGIRFLRFRFLDKNYAGIINGNIDWPKRASRHFCRDMVNFLDNFKFLLKINIPLGYCNKKRFLEIRKPKRGAIPVFYLALRCKPRSVHSSWYLPQFPCFPFIDNIIYTRSILYIVLFQNEGIP